MTTVASNNLTENQKNLPNNNPKNYSEALAKIRDLFIAYRDHKTFRLSDIDSSFNDAIKLVTNENVNDKYKNSSTLLEFAAIFDKTDIITHLLDKHVDALTKEEDNIRGAWYLAINYGRINSVRILLNNKHSLAKIIKTPYEPCIAFYESTRKGHVEILNLLLEQPEIFEVVKNLDKHTYIITAIENVAQKGHDKALSLLLNNQDVINIVTTKRADKLAYAIELAFKYDKSKTLKLLLENDAIINAIIKYNKKNNLKDALKTDKNFSLNDKQIDKIVAIRKQIIIKRTAKATLNVGIAVAPPLALTTAVIGGFVGMLAISKSNKIKNYGLVVNYLVPAFNKLNKQFIKISPKLDLNNLAKALTNPKIVALMVAITEILGSTASIVLGKKAYHKQGSKPYIIK